MALIKCPNCGQNISDKAPQCPKCGFKLHHHSASQPEGSSPEHNPGQEIMELNKQSLLARYWIYLIVGGVFVLVLAIGIGVGESNKNSYYEDLRGYDTPEDTASYYNEYVGPASESYSDQESSTTINPSKLEGYWYLTKWSESTDTDGIIAHFGNNGKVEFICDDDGYVKGLSFNYTVKDNVVICSNEYYRYGNIVIEELTDDILILNGPNGVGKLKKITKRRYDELFKGVEIDFQ